MAGASASAATEIRCKEKPYSRFSFFLCQCAGADRIYGAATYLCFAASADCRGGLSRAPSFCNAFAADWSPGSFPLTNICERDVNKVFSTTAVMGVPLALTMALSGCGTPAAKDFGGSWKPVNRFQDQTTEIPLAQAYTFYASPMDGTLKTMLTRWSKDNGMTLSYQLMSDYTLYKPVAQIHTRDVRAAAAELNSIYAEEGIFVTINDKQILVTVANVSKPDASEAKAAPGTMKPAAPTGRKP
jgi:hypothetical protein